MLFPVSPNIIVSHSLCPPLLLAEEYQEVTGAAPDVRAAVHKVSRMEEEFSKLLSHGFVCLGEGERERTKGIRQSVRREVGVTLSSVPDTSSEDVSAAREPKQGMKRRASHQSNSGLGVGKVGAGKVMSASSSLCEL